MKQFILENAPGGGRIRLEGKDYKYLAKARRLAPGEYFPVRLPDGSTAEVKVLSVGKHSLEGELSGVTGVQALSALPPLYLFQAMPKGEKMDLIARQAAEGAVSEIIPFVSEFSAVKTARTGSQKFERWQRIIKEARQQCGSAVATCIRQPVTLDGLFSRWEEIKIGKSGAIGLLFHQIPLANERLHRYIGKCPYEGGAGPAVVLAIGPEGGFSPAEAGRFIAAGFMPFTLGDTILRVETAALYAAAAVRTLLLERDSWETK